MATSSCPKCGSRTFEATEATPKNSRFRYVFVQCSSCGAVVGVMDFWNIGTLLHKLAEALHVDLAR